MRITIKQASQLIGVADNTIRNWVEEGKIKPYFDEKNVLLVDKKEILKQVPTVIALFNQKGGVGKTSTSVLLMDYYEKNNEKILLVDLDSQGSATKTFFAYEDIKDTPSLYDFFHNNTPLNRVVKTYNDNIDILIGDLKMSRMDKMDVMDFMGRIDELSNFFKKYNIVILDCPPSLSMFSRIGLIAANYIFCPLIPEPYSYEGMSEAIRIIQDLSKMNKNFIGYKAFLSSHKAHKSKVREIYIDMYREQLKEKLFENSIPDFIGVVERGISGINFFNMYPENDRVVQKIKSVMDEIDHYIFEQREI